MDSRLSEADIERILDVESPVRTGFTYANSQAYNRHRSEKYVHPRMSRPMILSRTSSYSSSFSKEDLRSRFKDFQDQEVVDVRRQNVVMSTVYTLFSAVIYILTLPYHGLKALASNIYNFTNTVSTSVFNAAASAVYFTCYYLVAVPLQAIGSCYNRLTKPHQQQEFARANHHIDLGDRKITKTFEKEEVRRSARLQTTLRYVFAEESSGSEFAGGGDVVEVGTLHEASFRENVATTLDQVSHAVFYYLSTAWSYITDKRIRQNWYNSCLDVYRRAISSRWTTACCLFILLPFLLGVLGAFLYIPLPSILQLDIPVHQQEVVIQETTVKPQGAPVQQQATKCCLSDLEGDIEKRFKDLQMLMASKISEQNSLFAKEIERIKQEKETVIVSPEVSREFSLSEVDLGRIQKMIANSIDTYDADKTGMPDYALESAGGSVISTRCTETYNEKSRLESIYGFPLWYSSYSPRSVIQRKAQGATAGECWAFIGGHGFLTIRLAGRIDVTAVSYEHLPKAVSPQGHINSAPKEFLVWSYQTLEDTTSRVLLGSFEYDDQGNAIQTFKTQNRDPEGTPIIELETLTNHGSEYTCLYRFRVHGNLRHED
ncbi:hypothetical protein L596_007588 [Steinernema carpocapsae]|uniref:SUN domain-containing protein n=1 Tax=Steinernema carpocapsae TaxID=34508 RepID=A0A4U5P9Y1_STECR|nr:hypothetical protein L596_007588 [Steinernema carpocapsae]